MIGIDWGSSGCRAYLLATDGQILDNRSAACGITTLTPAEYPAVLRREIGDWLEGGSQLVLLSGMVGSRQGWQEAGYVDCPAGLEDLPGQLHPVDIEGPHRAFIVPGVGCRTAHGLPEVMRGEEMQVFGLVGEGEDAELCMPGTHSKHVMVRGGRIATFTTAMTGEVFALLRRHGLLAATLAADDAADFDAAAFRAGLMRSGEPGGLLHHLFGVRTRRLFDELAASAGADYLSGILIGHELRGTAWQGGVTIVGAPELAARYRFAFELLGVAAAVAPEHAAASGLYRLGRMLEGGQG